MIDAQLSGTALVVEVWRPGQGLVRIERRGTAWAERADASTPTEEITEILRAWGAEFRTE
jgi:hypothetical protein